MRSNLLVLMAQKSQAERRRLTLRALERETGISYYTLTAIANDSIKEYPTDVMAKLCDYFQCELNDLLRLVDPAA